MFREEVLHEKVILIVDFEAKVDGKFIEHKSEINKDCNISIDLLIVTRKGSSRNIVDDLPRSWEKKLFDLLITKLKEGASDAS